MKTLNLYAGIGGNRKLWGEEKRFKEMYIDTAKEVKIVKIEDVRKRTT